MNRVSRFQVFFLILAVDGSLETTAVNRSVRKQAEELIRELNYFIIWIYSMQRSKKA